MLKIETDIYEKNVRIKGYDEKTDQMVSIKVPLSLFEKVIDDARETYYGKMYSF